MIKSKIVLLSALVSCALISGCKEENKTNVSIEFMHSSVEQERQAVISKLIARFEKENPGITVKQVPVEEDAYNTKVITLSRSGSTGCRPCVCRSARRGPVRSCRHRHMACPARSRGCSA